MKPRFYRQPIKAKALHIRIIMQPTIPQLVYGHAYSNAITIYRELLLPYMAILILYSSMVIFEEYNFVDATESFHSVVSNIRILL